MEASKEGIEEKAGSSGVTPVRVALDHDDVEGVARGLVATLDGTAVLEGAGGCVAV